MKARIVILSLMLVLSTISTAQLKPAHIDPVKVSPDKYTVLLENDNLRVVEYRIEPGSLACWKHCSRPSAASLRLPFSGSSICTKMCITKDARAWSTKNYGAPGSHPSMSTST